MRLGGVEQAVLHRADERGDGGATYLGRDKKPKTRETGAEDCVRQDNVTFVRRAFASLTRGLIRPSRGC